MIRRMLPIAFSRPRVIAFAALLPAFTGCVYPDQRIDEAKAKVAAAYAKCDADFHAGALSSHLAAVDCAAKDVNAAYSEAAYPFADLVYVSIEARRIGAANLDHRDIAEDQYRRDVAALDARIAAEDSRRRDIMRYGGSPVPATPNSLVGGLASFRPTPDAADVLPEPSGLPPNCLQVGGTTLCK